MKKKERILRPVKRASGGCYLPHLKDTAELKTVIMPPPKVVKIPLSQHIGRPAVVTVNKGDTVYVGTLIGTEGEGISAAVHSSVSGTVTDISNTHITIESDGKMTPSPDLVPFPVNKSEDFVEAASRCGLVGLGGAGFPASVKLNVKKGEIRTLIINGAECEPYITSDYRECIESYNDVIEGVYLLKRKLGIKKVVICIESNKKKAIEMLYDIATDKRDVNNKVRLMRLPQKYPQGAEKVIIYSATGKKLGLGNLPSKIGCMVMNITSIATLYRFIKTGMPLVSKRVTVDGTAVDEPKNVIVPIGTSIKELLDFVGVKEENIGKILVGGPMMGTAISDINSVVEKRNNGITVMKPELAEVRSTPCIRCGRCASACPMNLYPASVEASLRCNLDNLEKLNVNYCMECGCCSYVCPAKRPLTQSMRVAKAKLRSVKK